MNPVVFAQRNRVWALIRGQLILPVLMFLLLWFLAALGIRFLVGEALLWLAWVLGAIVAAGLAALIFWLRVKQILKAESTGSLRIDDQGLTAEYGSTTRHVAWHDIQRLERIPYPASTVENSQSIGGAVMAATASLTNEATKAKSLGILGAGVWADERATMAAKKLSVESRNRFGVDAHGRQLIPIWFDDYDAPEGAIEQLVRQRRPDLVAA